MIPQQILVVLRLADPVVLGQLFDQVCWETENKGKKMMEGIQGNGKGFRRGGRKPVEGAPPPPYPDWHVLLAPLGFDALYEILDAIKISSRADNPAQETIEVNRDVFKPKP